MRFRRALEVLLQPSMVTEEQVAWVSAEDVRVRVAGHELLIKSTKDGLEVSYVTPKNKKPKGVLAETSLEGARLRITP